MVSCRPAMRRGILGSEKSPFPYTYSLPPLLLLKQQHIISTRVAIMHPIYLLPLRVHIGLSPIWNTVLEALPNMEYESGSVDALYMLVSEIGAYFSLTTYEFNYDHR